MRVRSTSLALLITAAAFSTAAADEKKFGRLADGRAFRVDDQGYQLVDQVAELQVSVDELNRQVESLETELAEKDRKLLSGSPAKTTTAAELPAARSAQLSCPPATTISCDSTIAPYRMRVSELEGQLSSAKLGSFCDYESRTRPLKDQIASLQQTLRSNTSKITSQKEEEVARRDLQVSLAQSEESLTKAQNELESAQRKTQSLAQELAQRDQRLASLEESLKSRDGREKELLAKLSENETTKQELLALKSANSTRQTETTSRAMFASAAPATTTTVAAVTENVGPIQKQLQAKLSQIQSQIMKRKDLFDALKGRKQAVSISLSPLTAKNGVSLDTYRSRVSRLSSADNAKAIERGLDEISAVVGDDIRTIKRIGHL